MHSTARRRIAVKAVTGVILIQMAVLGAFLIDPSDPPRSGWLWQAIWGWWHRESFIPLILLLLLAPPLSWLAWSVRGGHRLWLVVAWLLFGAAATAWYIPRIFVMVKLIYEHKP